MATVTGADVAKAAQTVATSIEGVATKLGDIDAQLKTDGGNVKSIRGGLDDLNSYAVLTESIGPAQWTGGGSNSSAPTGSLGQVAALAVQQVLGWKPRGTDPRGFLAALNASFECKDMGGYTQCAWKQRTVAVEADLDGAVTGAQASLYMRAQIAIDQCRMLLDGLTNLRLDADPQDMVALKELIGERMTKALAELGLYTGPRIAVEDQNFMTMLGPDPLVADPDLVQGLIGTLRDEFGFQSFVQGKDFVNTVEEEQNLTNYRILCDYLTSLRTSWETNKPFFKRGPGAHNVFFGTRLVLLTRNLTVVAETVENLRMALDSVFIRQAERETLEIKLPADDRLFLEELLRWIVDFATNEGPEIITDGGKYGVRHAFRPVVQRMIQLVDRAKDPAHVVDPPAGYHTPRVRRAWADLKGQLDTLESLAQPIDHKIPSQQ